MDKLKNDCGDVNWGSWPRHIYITKVLSTPPGHGPKVAGMSVGVMTSVTFDLANQK